MAADAQTLTGLEERIAILETDLALLKQIINGIDTSVGLFFYKG